MLIALDTDNNRIRASPDSNAICPICKESVIPKCGTINIWHWAHKSNAECLYGEGIGLWHLRWQDFALKNGADVEVPIIDKFGNSYRADIVYNNKVIELQHSNISETDIVLRSDFYVGQKYQVDWVLDYTKKDFLEIESDCVTLDGRRKRVFDCLFYKLYGFTIFDMGNDMIFVTKKVGVHNEIVDINDYGTRRKKEFVYFGYFTKNILTLEKRNQRQLFEF